MNNAVEKYFGAEKAESALFVALGLVAIALAVYFFVNVKQPYYNGLSYALVVVALIQITVGGSVYVRSPKDILRVNDMLNTDHERIAEEEIPRMEVVMRNFVWYRWIEIILLAGGLLLYFYMQPLSLWKGLGLGLAIQSAMMLLLDLFAENRGKTYLEFLYQQIK